MGFGLGRQDGATTSAGFGPSTSERSMVLFEPQPTPEETMEVDNVSTQEAPNNAVCDNADDGPPEPLQILSDGAVDVATTQEVVHPTEAAIHEEAPSVHNIIESLEVGARPSSPDVSNFSTLSNSISNILRNNEV